MESRRLSPIVKEVVEDLFLGGFFGLGDVESTNLPHLEAVHPEVAVAVSVRGSGCAGQTVASFLCEWVWVCQANEVYNKYGNQRLTMMSMGVGVLGKLWLALL
jgi:hypothetical protein